ncbi:uncharacterized protein [Apostichopus japonicus]|uniref:uncharacterized protein n=1 Tax=Stichopus japonicus TaxID=307972 RepID=UPI003AB2ED9A
MYLPKPSEDSIWKSFDEQLYEELPTEIGEMHNEQLTNLETHVYKRLVDRFGVKPAVPKKTDKKQQCSRQQRKLRRLKKDTKRQYKQALRDGNKVHSTNLKKDFLKLVRLHNKVRKLELKSQQRKTASKEQHQFRQNPHKYEKRLLNEKQTRSPSFSKTAAEKFFKNVNSDKRRDYKYHPLKGLKRPPKPTKPFKTKPPSLSELNSYLQKRRNASAPGTNRIPYLVWKKCPRTTQLLHEVICGIWRTAAIPMSWRTGETILISKEENTSDPSCFRPITLKNSSGNLGMGILAQRTINYLTNNNYIDQSIQKGFMEKISGCVEHTEALTEMLQDAKKNGKPIVTTWLDLQNAYGTVPHNLVQFALDWYHVPDHIRKIIFKYSDELFIRVKTTDWTTDWIQCTIGVFQGCPLSCILFLAVFNLCLDLLDQLNHLGYCMSGSDITSSAKAYADDLTLIARSPESCQELVDTMNIFLKWTRTMKAKPSKCRSHAMKKVVPNAEQKQQGHKTQYVAYDPD